jgi:hypothetical protein
MSKFKKYSHIALCLIFGAVSLCAAQTSELPKNTSPGSCEQNAAILDNMRYVAAQGSGKDSLIIAVARLGNGETSRELNRRRLYNLGIYWKEYDLPVKRLILTEGARVNGFGGVELYIAGKLFDVLLVNRGKDLCVVCCGDDERYYPLRGKKRHF